MLLSWKTGKPNNLKSLCKQANPKCLNRVVQMGYGYLGWGDDTSLQKKIVVWNCQYLGHGSETLQCLTGDYSLRHITHFEKDNQWYYCYNSHNKQSQITTTSTAETLIIEKGQKGEIKVTLYIFTLTLLLL